MTVDLDSVRLLTGVRLQVSFGRVSQGAVTLQHFSTWGVTHGARGVGGRKWNRLSPRTTCILDPGQRAGEGSTQCLAPASPVL